MLHSLYQSVTALLIFGLTACATAPQSEEHDPRAEKATQLQQTLELPVVVEIAKKYDSKLGAGALRSALIAQGQQAWNEDHRDIAPTEAVDRLVLTDPVVMEIMAQGFKRGCESSSSQSACQNAETFRAQIDARKKCTTKNGTACLEVAFWLQRHNLPLKAMQFAQAACVAGKDAGCTLNSQLMQDKSQREAQWANAQAQERAAILQGIMSRPIPQPMPIYVPTFGTGNSPPATTTPVRCTTWSRPNLTGSEILDTECQ